MSKIVNLRQARKRLARTAREREAETNRVLHGLPASERKAAARQEREERRRHEAHRLGEGDGTGDNPGDRSC
ncbi:MAG: DUF4169 family protein [Pseudomonadota bacterium]|nr:DUF4169 family protein [Pseudomonadota bacterium]